jgi:murein DD-endopeptidase MepM/ murein hydrolase activator NlpD
MHLAGFGSGIHAGSRVSQGQVIGYVGSSGLSTGAHLDFRIYKNGQAINPLKVESPPAYPVNKKYISQFDSAARIYTKNLQLVK